MLSDTLMTVSPPSSSRSVIRLITVFTSAIFLVVNMAPLLVVLMSVSPVDVPLDLQVPADRCGERLQLRLDRGRRALHARGVDRHRAVVVEFDLQGIHQNAPLFTSVMLTPSLSR